MPMSDRLRRTKILATLGPATDPPGVLEALFKAGVNVVVTNAVEIEGVEKPALVSENIRLLVY